MNSIMDDLATTLTNPVTSMMGLTQKIANKGEVIIYKDCKFKSDKLRLDVLKSGEYNQEKVDSLKTFKEYVPGKYGVRLAPMMKLELIGPLKENGEPPRKYVNNYSTKKNRTECVDFSFYPSSIIVDDLGENVKIRKVETVVAVPYGFEIKTTIPRLPGYEFKP